ncbi:sel1 repeat family protein [Dyella telluris]|uniref:Sel1 repeat family protein n=1 Tax=Dyella telluris TaxID=2763498 RepID=A0A7G8PYV8_9GAMM|nr:sel1 repeat family protein [Dyella telluris]QNJ99715.1 sel1 repeat family protein [Dyella telluris]
MNRSVLLPMVLAVAGMLGGPAAMGQAASASGAPAMDAGQAKALRSLEDMVAIPGVLKEHPDLYYRQLAMNAYGSGNKAKALKLFLYAAGYADKPSQAALATLYWGGEGTAVDRPRAYAWMDLAASRGYARLVTSREYYWSQLSDEERAQALRVGKEILAGYNDELTLRRLRQKLDHARRNVTGSRLGFVGNGTVNAATKDEGYSPDNPSTAGLADYYSDALWNADEYARLKDLQWKVRVDAMPSVTVGDLQKVTPAPAPPGQ